MTWFRVGGAGIPASLKNAMNAVLNKKFGTSGQNYPPNGWPDDVNLLGPLPEKTVAGAIAHTDDAADTVPVKSVICSIVPKQAGTGTPSPTNIRALSGSTGMTIFQHGKNFIDYIEQGGIDAQNGAELSSNSRVRTGFIRVSPSTQYTAAVNSQNTNLVIYHVIEYSSNDTSSYISGTSKNTPSTTFATSANTNYIRLTARDVTSINITPSDLSKWQLETGSTATSFEAYNAAADVSDSWSSIGAILVGERDLTEGTLKKTYELIELKVSDMNNSENYPGWRNAGVRALGISSGYYTSWLNIGSGFSVNVNSSNDILFLPTGDYGMTQSQWIANYPDLTVQIIVPVGTPTEYTNLSTYDFETLYAVNNFFSDIVGGQTQLTYRQDIALALAALQGSRSLSASLMRSAGPDLEERSEDPEEVSELEENIQNTEEQEGENDER